MKFTAKDYLEKIASTKGFDPDSKNQHKYKRENSKKTMSEGALAVGIGEAAALPLGLTNKFSNDVFKQRQYSSEAAANLHTLRHMVRGTGAKPTFNYRSSVLEKTHKADNILSNSVKHMSSDRLGTVDPSQMPRNGVGMKSTKDQVLGSRFLDKNTHKIRHLNPDVLAHELGHAVDLAKHTKIKHIAYMAGHGAKGAGLAALTNEKTRDYAVPITAGMYAGQLRGELAANYHAAKGIYKHKGAGAAGKFVRTVGALNTASYGLGAAAGIGSVYATKKILDHFRKKDFESKNKS